MKISDSRSFDYLLHLLYFLSVYTAIGDANSSSRKVQRYWQNEQYVGHRIKTMSIALMKRAATNLSYVILSYWVVPSYSAVSASFLFTINKSSTILCSVIKHAGLNVKRREHERSFGRIYLLSWELTRRFLCAEHSWGFFKFVLW